MNKIPAILSISFRPFFLLVGLIAIVNPTLWLASYLGQFHFQLGHMTPLFWHGHEMIFGFTGAMIAGFILTASSNWTSSEPYKGFALLGLLSIWGLERLSYFLPLSDSVFFTISNLFFPLLTIMLFVKLIKFPKQKYVFIPILLVLIAAKLLHSGGHLFGNHSVELLGKHIAIGTLRLIILLIAGRVLPFFTQKKLAIGISVPPFLNTLSLVSVAALIIPWETFFPINLVAAFYVLAIGANIFRQLQWKPGKTIKVPILFVLHLGVAFINLNLILELFGLYFSEVHFSQASLHMLMAAGAGTVGIGMMSRVLLGHTGRVITADKWICLSYILVASGGFVRGLLPILAPNLYISSLLLSSILWSGGFFIFVLRFVKILMTPRPDGK